MTSVFSDLMADQKEPSAMDEFNKSCTLSYTTRLYGFGIFFGIGVILTVISAFMVPNIVTGNPERFAIPYAFGAVCSLSSTMFLMGTCSQLKSMFAKKRIIATIIYILSIVFTLVMALSVGIVGLVILAIIIQTAALFWYSISYIPYARTVFCNCCKGVVSV